MGILFLWVGLPFVAVGALILFAEARARRGTVAVPGQVIGFSNPKDSTDASFHTVAEYITPNGRRRLIESAVGSSAPMGRVGDEVSVLVKPEEPERAVLKSSATFIIGGTLALLGGVCCWVFFATFRADLFTVASSIAVTAFLAYKIHRVLANRTVTMAMALRAGRALRDEALRGRVFSDETKGQIHWANAASLEKTIRRQERVNRFAWPLLVLAGAGLLLLGWHLHHGTEQFLAVAVQAPGRVVDLAENDSNDGVTYAPVVEFEVSGWPQRFKDSMSSNPPSYRTGDAVPVLYDPRDPREARIDRGLWNRAIPLLVGAFGALLALCGVWVSLSATRRVPANTL